MLRKFKVSVPDTISNTMWRHCFRLIFSARLAGASEQREEIDVIRSKHDLQEARYVGMIRFVIDLARF